MRLILPMSKRAPRRLAAGAAGVAGTLRNGSEHRSIEQWSRQHQRRILREAAGIWSDRDDVSDCEAIRAAWERD